MGKSSQDHHNQGQEDRAEGNGYNAPHSELEKAFTWSNDDMDKIVEDNNAYKDGWKNSDSQLKK